MSPCCAVTQQGRPCSFRASRVHVLSGYPVCGHHSAARRVRAPGSPVGGVADREVCAAKTQRGSRCGNRAKFARQGTLVCGVHTRCVNLILFEPAQPAVPIPFTDSERDCRICFEPLARSRVTTLACGHRFCRPCARNHRRMSAENHRCPVCRAAA